MFYSKQTNGFYTREIHGGNIPTDAVEITAEQHSDLFQGQSEGKQIAADENGYPVLIDPPPPVPKIPSSVSRFQARAALYNAGLWESVETMMQAPETNMLVKLAWGSAHEFRRSSPLITELAAQLELTDDQLDDLFIAASKIPG